MWLPERYPTPLPFYTEYRTSPGWRHITQANSTEIAYIDAHFHGGRDAQDIDPEGQGILRGIPTKDKLILEVALPAHRILGTDLSGVLAYSEGKGVRQVGA